MSAELWVFGYGSLVWRPAFAYEERQPAYVEDWARRFWQGSPDHRGVPGAPGRVVTLVREAGARCAGIAYRVDAAVGERVLADLDVRERGGYAQHRAPLYRPNGSVLVSGGLLYLATESNPNYLGPASLREIAAQVTRSTGPSGPNVEYVLRLAQSLRALDADDPHVFALEALLEGAAPTAGGRDS